MKSFLSSVIFFLAAGLFLAGPTLAITSTFQITSSADDVNQDGTALNTGSSTVWLGTGGSANSSYAGFRFTNITVPPGSTVTSAALRVYSSQSQWLSVGFQLSGDLVPNSAVFNGSSKPSQRTLTAAKVNHTSNISWSANTWYQLDESKTVVQEIINQPGWQSGNSLSLILKGTGGAYGRKFARSFNFSPSLSPQLVITYTASGSTPTPTPVPPTATPTPVPTCDVTTVEAPAILTIGASASVWTVSASPSAGIVSEVDFTTDDSTVATVTSPGTPGQPDQFTTTVFPGSGPAGSTTLRASCVISGVSRGTGSAPVILVTAPTSTPTPTPVPSTETPTQTPTPEPTETPTPTPTSIPPTPTSTPTPTQIPPTPTPTPTTIPTPTPTPTPQPTPTPTPVPGSITAFSIGIGWSDVIPHQLVRTADDRVYVFGYSGDGSSTLNAHWTTVAGLPVAGSSFAGLKQVTDTAAILSVDMAYDGANIIHVLTNSNDGILRDRPFDITTNNFKATKILATGVPTVSGGYAGTSGVSSMMDTAGKLNVAYWASGNHIAYTAYTYNEALDQLTLTDGPAQLDGAESSNNNHPSLAISPLDGSVTVAWVSGTNGAGNIWARTQTGGVWGAAVKLNTPPVWTSPNSGINIDQGPSLLITGDGVKHLVYIENWRVSAPYDYGRVHYVTNSGGGWVDQYTGSYSHDPALAINSAGDMYVIGHGHSLNAGVCTNVNDMCFIKKNVNGTWGNQQMLIASSGAATFDSSPSVKWSVVGWNRPETIELVVPNVVNGYANSSLYYVSF